MVKHNNIKTSRSTKKSNRKNTFNKYGKNTSRGLRIKQSDMEKIKFMSEQVLAVQHFCQAIT